MNQVQVEGILKENGRKITNTIRSLLNPRNLRLVCARINKSETVVWRRKEEPWIVDVQMGNLKNLDRKTNPGVPELYEKKNVW